MKSTTFVGIVLGGLSLLGPVAIQAVDTDWLCEGASHQDEWLYHDWLGWFRDQGDGWVYHYEHRQLYVQGTETSSFYLYDMNIGDWFWSGCDVYPYLYKFGRSAGWYWYYRGCAPGERWFRGSPGQGDFLEYYINLPYGFVRCDPGAFVMGSPTDERGRQEFPSENQHTVNLTTPFLISPIEVSCLIYKEVELRADAFGYTDLSPGYWFEEEDPFGTYPIVGVSWYDAVKWLNLKSEVDGLKPVYYTSSGLGASSVLRTGTPSVYADWNASGYRLPTEAEWEYACRAGTTTAFYTGPITYTSLSPLDPNLGLAGWCFANSDDLPSTVSGKLPNDWGIYDTHGNVWEWCWDWMDDFSSWTETNPRGPPSGDYRIARGGSYKSPSGFCRSATRGAGPPQTVTLDLGFRMVVRPMP